MGKVNDLYWANDSAPGAFAQLASAYRAKHNVRPGDLKRAMAHISVKSHANGSLNPKAHLRNRVTMETVLNAPMVAEPLGLFDCCGVSDGSAAAIVTTPEIARGLGKKDFVSVKALQLAVSNGTESQHQSWDGAHFATTRYAAQRAYKEAGVTNPRAQLSLMEVHDCFSITELVTMEDLFISREGGAVSDVLDGVFDADGVIPCQIDGGLKCFGHPIGATGLRMLYELYLQLNGRAGERQLKKELVMGLTHNLGGHPRANVASVTIIGKYAA
jgi:acetyl-CoA C-acetyltransferase